MEGGVKYQEYKCKGCGFVWTGPWVDGDTPEDYPRCPATHSAPVHEDTEHIVVKSFRVTTRRPMQEHYNLATGSWEDSERGIREKLKAASDAASIRTGINHNFVPIDLRDKEACGVDDEGLDATYKRRRDTGQTSAKTVYIT